MLRTVGGGGPTSQARGLCFNSLISSNSDLSQISHCSISPGQVVRTKNMITHYKLNFLDISTASIHFCKNCMEMRKENF